MDDIELEKRQDMAPQVGDIKSTYVAVSWALETTVENGLSPSTESGSFEIYSGLSFILSIMAEDLVAVYWKFCDQ